MVCNKLISSGFSERGLEMPWDRAFSSTDDENQKKRRPTQQLTPLPKYLSELANQTGDL
jgi:hypothetical protein